MIVNSLQTSSELSPELATADEACDALEKVILDPRRIPSITDDSEWEDPPSKIPDWNEEVEGAQVPDPVFTERKLCSPKRPP